LGTIRPRGFCFFGGCRPKSRKQKKYKEITTSAYLMQVNADAAAGAILSQSLRGELSYA